MSGIDRFTEGLDRFGLAYEKRGALVLVTLDVEPPHLPGPHQVGTDPPGDFPNAPPHWLHLRAHLGLPDEQGHPSQGRASELGPDWRKWSRQHPKWNGPMGVPEWVAHARSLLLQAYKV